jgi:uncharacterized RDD family membrane protein YckC
MQLSYSKTNQDIILADLKKRSVAFLIDALLLFTVIMLVDFYTISSDESSLFLKPESILYLLLGWLYFAGTETCSCKATLGKYLMHIKVIKADNTRLSFKSASIRYFAKPVSAVVFLMRFIMGLSLDTHTPYHDKVAKALVVKE